MACDHAIFGLCEDCSQRRIRAAWYPELPPSDREEVAGPDETTTGVVPTSPRRRRRFVAALILLALLAAAATIGLSRA